MYQTFPVQNAKIVEIDHQIHQLCYGLPESGFVFCCFNHTYKIEPQIFTVWMEILANVPNFD